MNIDKNRIEAFFCDIDGTLINDKSKLSKHTIESVRKLNIPFFLVSGRNNLGMNSFAQELGLDTPRLTVNGNVIMKDGKVLYQGPSVPQDVILDVYSYLLSHYDRNTISLEAYDANEWFCSGKEDPYTKYEISVLGFEPHHIFSSAEELSSYKMAKLLIIADEKACDDIMERFSYIRNRKCRLVRNHATYIEIYAEGTDKGTGVLKACELLGINPKNCIACGDSAVDISMLECVGYPLSIGNADEEVKAKSIMSLKTNNDDGIASFIDEYLL